MIKIRISSSVKNFEEKILNNWPVEKYDYKKDINNSVVFFGMYNVSVLPVRQADWKAGIPRGDYQTFLNHKGKKIIFWCGSDILILYKFLKRTQADTSVFLSVRNICENKIEQDQLKKCGINAEIHPTFAGNVDNYSKCCKQKKRKHIWLCMHKGREKEYGLYKVLKLANQDKNKIFHIYGINGYSNKNIIYHGQVSEKQLDKEIKNYQIAARFNKFDGFSEVVAKGILLGQEIWSEIDYPRLDDRNYWVKKLKDFSWFEKK